MKKIEIGVGIGIVAAAACFNMVCDVLNLLVITISKKRHLITDVLFFLFIFLAALLIIQ